MMKCINFYTLIKYFENFNSYSQVMDINKFHPCRSLLLQDGLLPFVWFQITLNACKNLFFYKEFNKGRDFKQILCSVHFTQGKTHQASHTNERRWRLMLSNAQTKAVKRYSYIKLYYSVIKLTLWQDHITEAIL